MIPQNEWSRSTGSFFTQVRGKIRKMCLWLGELFRKMSFLEHYAVFAVFHFLPFSPSSVLGTLADRLPLLFASDTLPKTLLLSPLSLPSSTPPTWKMRDGERSPTAASSLSRPNVVPDYRPRRPSQGRFSSPNQRLSEEEQRSFEVRQKQVWLGEGARLRAMRDATTTCSSPNDSAAHSDRGPDLTCRSGVSWES